MISSSNPTSKLPILAAAIGLLAYAPVENQDVSTQQDCNNFSLYAIVDYIDSITNREDSSRENVLSNFKLYISDIDSSCYVNNFLSSTYIETEESQVIKHNNDFFNGLLNRFIALLNEDDENSYYSSNFLTENFKLNETACIEVIQTAFRKTDYIYAKDVITAVRFSEINYFQPWFKNLLEEGLAQKKLRRYINNLLDLYKEIFDTL